MSYILSALKKSEQERQRGKIPNIHTAVVTKPPPSRYGSVWPNTWGQRAMLFTITAFLTTNVVLLVLALDWHQRSYDWLQSWVAHPSIALTDKIAPAEAIQSQPSVAAQPDVPVVVIDEGHDNKLIVEPLNTQVSSAISPPPSLTKPQQAIKVSPPTSRASCP